MLKEGKEDPIEKLEERPDGPAGKKGDEKGRRHRDGRLFYPKKEQDEGRREKDDHQKKGQAKVEESGHEAMRKGSGNDDWLGAALLLHGPKLSSR